ncbi:MAG: indole-3-glycerol phosphate synthase TrpC [Actinomycetes bacterium]
MNRLERIVERTRETVERRMAEVPQAELIELLPADRPERTFLEALGRPGISLIAEHKRRSPSAGAIREDLDLESVVSAYEQGGATALSILTEEDHFGGSLDDLRRARAITDLPILRKDFTVGSYQLYEAANAGADAILLIVAALPPSAIGELSAEARELGLDVLVEVHDEDELGVALEQGADLIGINNRDLRSFEVDVNRTFELLADIPAGKTVVSESGIRDPEQVAELDRVGVDAILVGEALMRSGDLSAATRQLLDRT